MNRELLNKRTSELIGKKVCDASGSLIGTVTDVELNLDKAFSLILSTQDMNPSRSARELAIEANEIALVKDVVLLKTTREAPPKRCPECGYANPTVARYCRECGTELDEIDYPLIRRTAGKEAAR